MRHVVDVNEALLLARSSDTTEARNCSPTVRAHKKSRVPQPVRSLANHRTYQSLPLVNGHSVILIQCHGQAGALLDCLI